MNKYPGSVEIDDYKIDGIWPTWEVDTRDNHTDRLKAGLDHLSENLGYKVSKVWLSYTYRATVRLVVPKGFNMDVPHYRQRLNDHLVNAFYTPFIKQINYTSKTNIYIRLDFNA